VARLSDRVLLAKDIRRATLALSRWVERRADGAGRLHLRPVSFALHYVAESLRRGGKRLHDLARGGEAPKNSKHAGNGRPDVLPPADELTDGAAASGEPARR
jgi:hypothetical protein